MTIFFKETETKQILYEQKYNNSSLYCEQRGTTFIFIRLCFLSQITFPQRRKQSLFASQFEQHGTTDFASEKEESKMEISESTGSRKPNNGQSSSSSCKVSSGIPFASYKIHFIFLSKASTFWFSCSVASFIFIVKQHNMTVLSQLVEPEFTFLNHNCLQ